MEQGDRNFYRPAILWGGAAGVGAFIAEYVANDGTLGRALVWAALAAILVGLFFARLLGMRDGRQTRPRHYAERQIGAPGTERESK
ncbi:MAG: hypothetical protein M3279_07385 [Actinomycetota bacterium]|nr:hypothetical protein [Actinomycetota bacterium]